MPGRTDFQLCSQNFTSPGGQFYLMLIQCAGDLGRSDDSHVRVHYVLKNGQSQLSAGDEGAPSSSAVFVALWLAAALYWAVAVCALSPRRTRLHGVVAAWLCLKQVQTGLTLAYWLALEADGVDSETLRHSYLVFESLGDTLMFSVLLLVGKGWLITRAQLYSFEWRSGVLAMLCMLTLLIFFVFYSSSFFFSFSLWLLVACLFLLPRVLAFITENKRLLDNYCDALRRRAMPGRLRALLPAAEIKRRLFAQLRVVVLLFIALVLLVSAVRVVVIDWKLEWLGLACEGLVDWLMGMALVRRRARAPALFSRRSARC